MIGTKKGRLIMFEQEVVIKSLDEYVKELMEVSKIIDEETKDAEMVDEGDNELLFETRLLFRGVDNKEYTLLPSIARNGQRKGTIFQKELTLINETKFRLPDVFTNLDDPVDKLAKLQHIGIPTRMLDVTSNALVALYFVCYSDFDHDGAIYLMTVRNGSVSHNSIENAIADLSNTCCCSDTDFDLFLKSVEKGIRNSNDQKDYEWLLSLKNEIPKQQDLFHDPVVSVEPWYVKAKAVNSRQLAQSGEYLLFINDLLFSKIKDDYKISFNNSISPIFEFDNLEESNYEFIELRKKVIVPKENKKDFLASLSYLGIDQSFLFPDSVDIVCKNIRDKFF